MLGQLTQHYTNIGSVSRVATVPNWKGKRQQQCSGWQKQRNSLPPTPCGEDDRRKVPHENRPRSYLTTTEPDSAKEEFLARLLIGTSARQVEKGLTIKEKAPPRHHPLVCGCPDFVQEQARELRLRYGCDCRKCYILLAGGDLCVAGTEQGERPLHGKTKPADQPSTQTNI